MAAISSHMIPLGTKAADFTLPDTTSGKHLSLQDLKSDKATVIMFLCNHCPYVKHVNSEIVAIAGSYRPRGVSFIAISSNDVENYPQDSPERMAQVAREEGYSFPYLYDETQEVARAYHAACTPDFYIFDRDLRCAYRGQLDDSRPGNGKPVTGKDLRQALDDILEGRPVSFTQMPGIGCSIKWK